MKDKKKKLKEQNAKEIEKARPSRDQEQPEDDESEEDPAQVEGDKQLMKRLGIDPKKAAKEPIEDEEEEPDYIEQEPEPTSLDAKEEPEAEYGAFNEDEGKEWDPNYGRNGIIDEEVIGEAKNTYEKYKQNLEKFKKRIVENEKWWQFKQWEVIGDAQGKENDPKPESAWMFDSLANKHADAMDFEGVEELRRKVGENGNLNEKLNQLASIAMQMAGMLDQTVGAGEFTSQVQQALGMEVAPQLNAAAYEARRGIDRPVNTRAANIRDRASNQASVGEGHDISKTDE